MLVVADRVKQTSITQGTGTIVFNSTFGAFQSFSDGIGDGNSTYYVIENNSNFEVGIGTYTESTDSLSRDTILVSSNNNTTIDLVGVSLVFCTYPASKAFFNDDYRLTNSRDPNPHTHPISGIINLQNELNSKQPSGNYANTVHTHYSSDILDFAAAVSSVAPPTTDASLLTTGTLDDDRLSANVVFTDDSRLSDARTPLSHNHIISEVSGLQTVLDSKQPSGSYASLSHNHNIADISGLQTALDGKQPSGDYANSSHTHTSSAITDFNTSVSGLVSGIYAPLSSPTLTGVPLAPTASSGTNTNQIASTSFVRTEISNLVASAPATLDTLNELASALGNDANFSTTITNSLANKANLSGASFTGSISSPSGSFTSILVNGINVSLSGHSHSINDVSGLQTALDSKQPSGSYANASHMHEIADVSGLQTALDSKQPSGSYANASHMHEIADVSGLQTALDSKQPSGSYANAIHTHNSSDITDFNSSVSGLLPVKNIVAGSNISVTGVSGTYTISNSMTSVETAASVVTTVFNKTGSLIPKMTAVYINGGQGDLPTIQKALATADISSAGTYGITYEAIDNMGSGRVIALGALTGLDTDQFNPTAPVGDVNGSILYLSPTVSGGLTRTKPYAPYHIVALGTIVRTHQNAGVIEVRVQNGYELEELHDVAVTGVTNGQFLQYNTASGLWLSSSSGNFNTLQVSGTNVSVNGHTHTSSNITDFNSSVSGLLPIKALTAGTNIEITSTTGNYTISVTGVVSGGGGGAGVVISNSGANRVLTSDGTTSGINAQSNLTFDGSLLTSPSGNFTTNLQVGSTSLTSNDVLNILNSNNLYLWSNFR